MESIRIKLYFYNYYINKNLLLKESFTNAKPKIDILMQVSLSEFFVAIYLYKYLFGRRPNKYIMKLKYGQKQDKLPLKLQYTGKQIYSFLFIFRYFFSILAKKNKQIYNYKSFEHKLSINFMELSILFKNLVLQKNIDLYELLSDLNVDIYINNNENANFSSYYSFFRYII